MFNYPRFIIKHRKKVIAFVLLAAVVCAVLFPMVGINYNIIDYLPQDATSTVGLNAMNELYPGGVPNGQLMVENISIPEALELKAAIESIDGVNKVTWLDDSVSTEIPVEYLDKKIVDNYYRDGTALFTLTLADEKSTAAVHEIRDLVGDDAKMSGSAVSTAFSGDTITSDLITILIVAIPLVCLILIFATTSWIEPLLFLFTIGIAVAINMGTNIIFGEISFVTMGIAALLQLAISIDYAIFLLHRYAEFTRKGIEAETAMELAMKHSSKSIVASAITGAVGFSSLLVMRFLVGPDVGLVMIKGILISLVCVFTLLPALTVCLHKLLKKTTHRPLFPDLHKLAKVMQKISIPCAIIIMLLMIPCVPAVMNSHYVYADVLDGPDTKVGQDKKVIQETFGQLSSTVLMVPNGNFSNEREMVKIIEDIPIVTNVLTYSKTVGSEIPQEFIPEDTVSELVSGGYTRFVITADSSFESDAGFAMIEQLRELGEAYYPGQWLMTGEISNAYDLKNSVREDDLLVNIVSIGGIFLVLAIIFRSLITPAILLIAIESAIWITCSVPYFLGQDLFYFGRMIIFALLLAATVDYGILFADRYFEFRRKMKKKQAVVEAFCAAGISVITSAVILFVCGLALQLLSSNVLLSALGSMIARGSVLAFIGVLFVIPALFVLLDKPIQKLTRKADFYPEDAPEPVLPASE